MLVRYVGPSDAVEVGPYSARKGDTIDVPADLAGRPPVPRLAEAMRELHDAVEAHDHSRAVALRDEITDLDFGAGLLAQPEVWQPVAPDPARSKRVTDDAEAGK